MACGNHVEGGCSRPPPYDGEREDVGLIIVCNSCSAQYSVSDAKVRGKLVRITCKHCSTAIVVDGRQMLEGEVPSQKSLSSYALPRRDESVVAAMPQSLRAPVHPPASSPGHAPVSAPVQSAMQAAMSAALREEDQTMIARSRFGDDMSVHDERTVIGQIPKEALEFERMFAQRTQPPPPDEPSKPTAAAAPAAVPSAPAVPKLDAEASNSERPESDLKAQAEAEEKSEARTEEEEDETENIPQQGFSRSEPPTVGNKPSSDSRGLVSLAEATHPSVARSASARRLRVTLITMLVLGVLVLLFVMQKPH